MTNENHTLKLYHPPNVVIGIYQSQKRYSWFCKDKHKWFSKNIIRI